MTKLCLKSLILSVGNKTLLHDLSMTINKGERWGLLGKNGAGKTSLLKCLAGILSPKGGSISLDSIPMKDYSRNQLAQHIGMLFQEGLSSLPATVLETVLLGRHPHHTSLIEDSLNDLQMVDSILGELGLETLKERKLHTLSGGELQRVSIALLLAQDPKIFLLDEPTNHLDIAFQVRLSHILTKRVTQTSASFLLATHDINYANQFCDKLILMLENGKPIVGDKQQILTEENLSQAYNCKIEKFSKEDSFIFYPA